MHRVRTWARAKAHGPAPLVSETRRSNSRTNVSQAPAGAPAGAPSSDAGAASASTEVEKPAPEKKNVAVRFFLTFKDIIFSSPINILLVFVPVGIAVHFINMSAGVIFAMNAIAIIPLAGLLSHATESVASRLGDTVGALMNVTFGNAVELIIFIIALVKNEIRIVQASLIGSILSNLLLILGMCFLLGGLRFREQIYNSTVTQTSACLLSLSVISLLLPTAFHASFSSETTADEKVLPVSRGTSVVLLLVYGLYLLFQLNSHAYMYESTPQHIIERESVPGPAAHFFDSSSSSDETDSSDTDDSTGTNSTAKRIRRMMRGKKSRKQSSSSQHTPTIRSPPGENDQTDGAAVSAANDPDAIVPAEGAAVEDDDAASQLRARRRKKHRKHHRKHRASIVENAEEQAQSATAEQGGDTRRVDFAVMPDVEAQTETPRPKPFSLRALRPPIPKAISQNVFTASPSAPVPARSFPDAGAPRQLRRATSMPNQGAAYRPSGALPPITPIIVGKSVPKIKKDDDSEEEEPQISRTTAIILLLTSTALVALCAEFMVDSINEIVGDGTSDSGISEAFIGLILLPIVGNAAEHVTAVTVAMKNKMDLAIGVALGSSIQIAIFVTPLVIILGWIMDKEMSLFFTLFETVCLFVSAFIVNFLVLDGRSNYLEGALLCAAYIIIAVAAFFYPSGGNANSLGGGTG